MNYIVTRVQSLDVRLQAMVNGKNLEAGISVIIPAYNVEKYIKKCIDSCLEIKDKLKEIIIVNDGSTDGTEDVLRAYDEEKIRVFTTENNGLSMARNIGMKNATGEYLLFLDSDDWLEPSVGTILTKEELQGLDVLFYRAQEVSEAEPDNIEQQPKYWGIDEGRVYSGEEILEISNMRFIPHEAWRGIYRSSFLREHDIAFLHGVLYEDNAFWFDIMYCARSIKYTNEIYYNYLIRQNSIVHSFADERNIDSVHILINHILSVRESSQTYLNCAAEKASVLMLCCERKVRTAHIDMIIKNCDDIIEKKKELIYKINCLYKEDTPCQRRNKYLLLSDIVFFAGIYDADMLTDVKRLRERILGYYKDEMAKWPLQLSDKRVGIYGSGRNSDIILNLYEKLWGKIKAEYCYIDSNKEDFSFKHYNRDIININNIDKHGIDEVIICSNLYERDMFRVMQNKWENIPVYRLYKDEKYSVEGILKGNYVELYRVLKESEGKNRIILIGTPEYPNVGDHLITIAEYSFFKDYFPEYEIIEITNNEYYNYKLRLKSMIKDSDVLVITGGGFLGTLWVESLYSEVLDIALAYKNNKVWIMPQSVYFSDDMIGKRYEQITRELFNRENIRICLREEYSYKRLKNIGVSENNLKLFPDIALYLQMEGMKENNRSGAGMFLRNDKESILDIGTRENIKNYIKNKGIEIFDDTMQYATGILKEKRDTVIKEKLEQIGNYKIIITDQLHCMISCVLTYTPCIAINNISKKLEGVYEWIKTCEYVKLVHNVNELIGAFNDVLYVKDYKPIELQDKWDEMYSFLLQ